MKQIVILLISLCFSGVVIAQKIDIKIKETPPYYLNDTLHVDVFLHNTTNDSLVYFDSRGSSWDSFKENWDLNVTSQMVEILPLNNKHDHNFADSTIVTLQVGDTSLIRSHFIPLAEVGMYSLTYSQEQGPHLVQKRYADSDSTYIRSQKITAFGVSKNIKFEVQEKFDTTIHEIINMPWEEWKDYRHVKLHTRKKIFRNINAAFLYPQDVYSLAVSCNGTSAETIKRIGNFKNLRSLTLRYYELDHLPKEIAELDLYELTIVPKEGVVVDYSQGLSQNNTLRELKAKFYGGVPEQVLSLKHLIKLDVSDCPIENLPNLSSLKNLEVLIANNANLSSLNNIGLDQLPKLKEVNFSGNKAISDFNPLLKCTNLEFLVINRTSIPEVPDEIENLSKLKKLSISNKITAVSDSICNLSDMRYLSFGGNRSLTQIPDSIIKMKKLLHFDISSTKIEQLPVDLPELHLEKLYIYNSPIKITKDYKELKKRLGERFKD